jgi:hypothetical protein
MAERSVSVLVTVDASDLIEMDNNQFCDLASDAAGSIIAGWSIDHVTVTDNTTLVIRVNGFIEVDE